MRAFAISTSRRRRQRTTRATATLRTGEDVVIKVQKAGVQGSLRADLDLLYGTARVLELLGVSTSELSVSSTLRP